jgi:hypothetical protein
MKKTILALFCLGILLVLPNLVLADCTDFSRATSSYAQDGRTIIFYGPYAPIAEVVLMSCTVNASSNISLLGNYVCESDNLIVDGRKCAIMTLESTSAGPLNLGH